VLVTKYAYYSLSLDDRSVGKVRDQALVLGADLRVAPRDGSGTIITATMRAGEEAKE
jgi:hypothetical protein